MSVINKKPLINQILSGLSAAQLKTLRKCINGEGPEPIFRSLKPISNVHLTPSDYGVKPIKLELAIPLGGMSIYEGYLIYTASMCYVISYAGEADQGLTILKIDVSKSDVKIMEGSLSILGLRSELDDSLDEDENSEAQVVGTPETLAAVQLMLIDQQEYAFLFTDTIVSSAEAGLFILMFNTTKVVIPWVKGQESRFNCNAIYNNGGSSMTARGDLIRATNGFGEKMVNVYLDKDFGALNTMTTQPYGVLMFIPLNV